MASGSRSNLIRASGEILQAKFARSRLVMAERFQVLRDAGAFRAPVHLAAPLQGGLGLPEPLRPDPALAEGG